MTKPIIVALLSILYAHAALADESPAAKGREHYRKAISEYGAKEYEAAIADFRDAYAYDPRPEVLYAWAQAERLSGDCPSAIVLYKRFLDGGAIGAQADAARANQEKCEQALATRPVEEEQPAPKPKPAPIVVVAAPAVKRAPKTRRAHVAWWKDPLGDGLVAGGAVALAIGLGYLSAADDAQSAAAHASTYDQYAAEIAAAGSHRTVGAVSLSIGAAIVAGGVVRWVYASRHGEIITITPATGGGMVSIAGRF
jgi:hypothetical protein